ncbi:MAG: ABC transporter ATP-binding protein/permease [Lachnospiraceae bacterium]|nr:ABC transporter ATP-binding protein/permease [Lachnospiraceae bacterium]
MRVILRYFNKKSIAFLPVCVILIILQAYLELKIPDYMSQMTKIIEGENASVNAVIGPGCAMFVCALLSLILCGISGYLISGIAASLSCDLRSAVFKKTLDFSMEEMGRFGSASLITRCTQDIQMIQVFFTTGLQMLIKAPFLAGIAIYKISGKQSEWTITTAVAILIIMILTVAVIILCAPLMARTQLYSDELNGLAREHISGIRVIHAFNSYDFHSRRFSVANENLSGVNRKTGTYVALMMPGFVAVMFSLNLFIYVLGIGVVMNTPNAEKANITADMVAFSSYALQIVQAFLFLIQTIIMMPRTLVSSKRIGEVLETIPAITDGEGNVKTDLKGTVEFRNVSFRYPNSPEYVLKDISFTAGKGQTVAFIGATGSGKTTLMNLIPRFYDATEGQILVNGVDVRDYRQKDLRNLLGYVPQKSRLFTGTIAGNIAYGDNGRFSATLGEIQRAADIGQAREFIEQKPDGYDTKVQSGGSNFSGGQRQRLTISRAICRDPEIFLFDDSFSALDFATDNRLRKTLRKTAGDATVLIVAQRIGTIRNADRIYVMDEGRIVGSGTHEELMNTCEIYMEIARTQLAEKAM